MKASRVIATIISIIIITALMVGCAPQATPTAELTTTDEPAAVEEPAATTDPNAATSGDAGKWQISADNLKVALLLDGPVNDGGWNEYVYNGLVAIQEKYNAETAYSESVQRADMETVFGDYAARGYNVILAHGYEFTDAAKTVAANYPESIFIVTHAASGFAGPNTASIQFEEEQIAFVLGVLAGASTKTNKIACLGGYEIPAISIPFQAFTLGAQAVNPDVDVTVSWLETWTDVAKMKEAGIAAIDNGADIILPVAVGANAGGYDAVKEKDVWGVGYSGDASAFAPDNVLGSAIIDTGGAIVQTVDKIVDGTFTGTDYWYGIKDGTLYMTEFNKEVPQEVIDQVNEWFEKIKSGEYEVPVKMTF
ncbi:MAG TPA: BMP family protein [Anaerolineaceae bacterium]|nr:BMP family protein [Anaerolineaceae bacterium]